MREIKIIPCLDIKGDRVVKGVKFENLKDARDPVEAAIAYSNEGADELVFLDIFATVIALARFRKNEKRNNIINTLIQIGNS